MCKLIVFQSPFGCYEEVGGTLADKAFEYKVGAKKADVICYELDILFNCIKMKGILSVHLCKTGTTDNLQLMNLQRC